ncbi:PilW family protein [Vibrio sp. 10N.261.51.F12]|uniref:PilW family protein n=1 Tax=Vibrio sp. 10N.261.51.F12 TaxID=3229679 RepID=UPI00354FBA4C
MRLCREKGGSLIEMLIASTIGLIAIGSIGSIYLVVQQHASERSQVLLLNQAMATAARRIQNDLLRAGYSELGTTSRPLGATSTIHVSADGARAQYVYWDDHQESGAEYENVLWTFSAASQSLRICRYRKNTILDTNYFSAKRCTSLLEEDLISVTHFALGVFNVSGPSASKQYLHLSMAAQLRGNSEVTASMERKFLIRNGQ